MPYALLLVLLLAGCVSGDLIRYKTDPLDARDASYMKEVKTHFRPLHILPNGEFISAISNTRRDLRVKNIAKHEKNFVYYRPSRRLIVHSVSNISVIRSIVGYRGVVIKERLFDEDNSYDRIYVVTFLDDARINQTLVSLNKDTNILWVDFLRPMHVSNVEAIKATTGQYFGHESGKNVIITIADTGLDTKHCMFSDPANLVGYHTLYGHRTRSIIHRAAKFQHSRVKAYISVEYGVNGTDLVTDKVDTDGGHGTHVAGSAAGSGCNGVTSGAKLIIVDMYNSSNTDDYLAVPDLLTPTMHLVYAMGSRIFSNSWGSSDRFYTSYEYELDRFVLQHPDFICIFAAGNDGDDTGTVGSPGSAKNCITVGATLNTYESFYREGKWDHNISTVDKNTLSIQYTNEENIAYFSSRGPTIDGRIKPDISAPGMFILSANANSGNGQLFMQGTSMATPIVTRIVSMIIERLGSPSAPLVKAILVACSKHMHGGSQRIHLNDGQITFDKLNTTLLTRNDYGHGRLHADLFFTGALETDDNIYVNTSIIRSYSCSRTGEVTFVMAYSDYPSIPGTNASLVNNIDMFIEHASRNTCVVHYPNGLDRRDTVNNVEKISLVVAAGDSINVHLIPGAISSNVALVWSSSLHESDTAACGSYIPKRRVLTPIVYFRMPSSLVTLIWVLIFAVFIPVDYFTYCYFLKRDF